MATIPLFTMHMTIGIEGMADSDHREELLVEFDPELTDEQNQQMLMMKAQIGQMRMQLAMQTLLATKMPEIMAKIDPELLED